VSAASSAVLSQLDLRQPLYAVLDGARDPRVRRWVFDTRAPAWCLYRGAIPPALEDAAPWLLRLVPGHPYVDDFFGRLWGQSWGILLTSAAPSRELRRHLRRFLRVRTEEGRILAFRYYDPRVLRVYLPTCTPSESASFFGPITSLVAEAEDASVHVFRPASAVPGARSTKLWTVRREQLAAFAAAFEQKLADRAAAHVRRRYPERCAALGDAAVRASVATALEKRAAYRFDSEETLFAWLDLMYLLGSDFDSDPWCGWVHPTLTDFDLGARTRLLWLVEEARARAELAARPA
jgi:hypothetical protein